MIPITKNHPVSKDNFTTGPLELRKISGENFLRVFEQVEKVSARLQSETKPYLIKN